MVPPSLSRARRVPSSSRRLARANTAGTRGRLRLGREEEGDGQGRVGQDWKGEDWRGEHEQEVPASASKPQVIMEAGMANMATENMLVMTTTSLVYHGRGASTPRP